MSNICQEHNLKYKGGCLKCHKIHCIKCLLEKETCTKKAHKLLMYSEYIEAVKKEGREKILKNIEMTDIGGNILEGIVDKLKKEIARINEEEDGLMKKAMQTMFQQVQKCRGYILNYRKYILNQIRMVNILEKESLKLRKSVQNLKDEDIEKISKKLEILPNILTFCSNECAKPVDLKIEFKDRSESLSIKDQFLKKMGKYNRELDLNPKFLEYSSKQTENLEKFCLSNIDNLDELYKCSYSIKLTTGHLTLRYNKYDSNFQAFEKLTLLNLDHLKNQRNSIYKFRNANKLVMQFEIVVQKYQQRKKVMTLKEDLLRKRRFKSTYKILKDKLSLISMDIKKLKLKLVPEGIFKPSIAKGKGLSFERKLVNSPYLFYSTWASPIVLHLYNLINKQQKPFNFYNSNQSWYDVEQHDGRIFICGGHDGSELKTSWMLELSNLKTAQAKATNNTLIDTRRAHTLVSTPFELFALGGYANSASLKSSEKLTKAGLWQKSEDLNFVSGYVTASYIYPDYLYKFGAWQSSAIERLYLRSSSRWEDLQVQNSTERHSGCPLQLSLDEVLLINGSGAPSQFQKFNLKPNTLSNTGKTFTNYRYFHSKIRMFAGKIHVVSIDSKKRITITFDGLNYSESNIDF